MTLKYRSMLSLQAPDTMKMIAYVQGVVLLPGRLLFVEQTVRKRHLRQRV